MESGRRDFTDVRTGEQQARGLGTRGCPGFSLLGRLGPRCSPRALVQAGRRVQPEGHLESQERAAVLWGLC